MTGSNYSNHMFLAKYEDLDRTNSVFKSYNKHVKVFPNPGRNTVTIDDVSGNVNMFLFDVMGREQATNISRNETRVVINTEALSRGVYFIRLTDAQNGSSGYVKWVKE